MLLTCIGRTILYINIFCFQLDADQTLIALLKKPASIASAKTLVHTLNVVSMLSAEPMAITGQGATVVTTIAEIHTSDAIRRNVPKTTIVLTTWPAGMNDVNLRATAQDLLFAVSTITVLHAGAHLVTLEIHK